LADKIGGALLQVELEFVVEIGGGVRGAESARNT
jgi:hypothetical protein